ncbi:hypothetical protein Vretimale_16261 [Volvox reticuliferus]|nr:hypothetical protein Vretimale_16261 [Volvox reticuliferus]
MPPSATKPPAPPVAPMPPDVPSAPPIPPAAESVMTTTSPPRPPLFPHLPGISPLRPYAPPQPPQPPGLPAHLRKRLPLLGALQPDRPEPPWQAEPPAAGESSPSGAPSSLSPPFPAAPTPHPTLHRPSMPSVSQYGRPPNIPFPSPAPASRYPPPISPSCNSTLCSPKRFPLAPPLTSMPTLPPLHELNSEGIPSQPARFNCSLAVAQASFAIPSVSRGSFYIVLSVPEAGSAYCMFCGCSVMYTVLERGVSYLYSVHEKYERQVDSNTTMTAAAVVSPPSHPPPPTTHPLGSPGGRSSSGGSNSGDNNISNGGDGTTGANADSSLLAGSIGMHGNNESTMFLNTILPQNQHAGQNVSKSFLPSLEDLVLRGASAPGWGRGTLEEIDVLTGRTLWSPPHNSVNATVIGNSSGGSDGASGTGNGSTYTMGAIGAAWRMDPGSSGDHLFRIQVGERVWYRWVVVDIEPPFVSGRLFISNDTIAVPGLVTGGSGGSNNALFQQFIVQVDVSEPVQQLDPTSILSVSGSATFVGAKCFASAADASVMVSGRVVATAGMRPLADAAEHTPTPTQVPEINLRDFPAEGNNTDEALASGLPYVRSCVAVMYVLDGSGLFVTLPAGAIKDFAGNSNEKPVLLNANLMDPALASAYAIAGTTTSALVGSIFAGATLSSTSASFLTSVTTRTPMLQNACHLQMLAMTANIASPGISYTYRRIAKYLRWSLLGVKGNIPILDNAFSRNASSAYFFPGEPTPGDSPMPPAGSNNMTVRLRPRPPPVNTIIESRPNAAPPPSSHQPPPLTPSLLYPPMYTSAKRTSTYQPIHTATDMQTYNHTYMSVRASRILSGLQRVIAAIMVTSPPVKEPQMERPLSHGSTTVPPSRPTAARNASHSRQMIAVPFLYPPTLSPLHRQRALASAAVPPGSFLPSPPLPPSNSQSIFSKLNPGRDALLAWLRNFADFRANITKSVTSSNESDKPGSGFSLDAYVLGGAAAAGENEVIGVDATGQVLESTDGSHNSPPAAPPVGYNTAGQRYTIPTAEIQDLPYTLAIAGLLMAGLVCIHTLIIMLYKWFIDEELAPFLRFPRMEVRIAGSLLMAVTFFSSMTLGQWENARVLAVLVLTLLVLPYFLLLWWLTMCRWYLCEQPIQDAFYSLSSNWNGLYRASQASQGVPEIAGMSPGSANDGGWPFGDGMKPLPEEPRPDITVDTGNTLEGDNAALRKHSVAMLGPHWALARPALAASSAMTSREVPGFSNTGDITTTGRNFVGRNDLLLSVRCQGDDDTGREAPAAGEDSLISSKSLLKRPRSTPATDPPSCRGTLLRSPARSRAYLTESSSLFLDNELEVGEGRGLRTSELHGDHRASPGGITCQLSVEQQQQQQQQQHGYEIVPAGAQMEGNLSRGACQQLTSLQQNVKESEEGLGMTLPTNEYHLPAIARPLQQHPFGRGVGSEIRRSHEGTEPDGTKDRTKHLKRIFQEGDNKEAADDGPMLGAVSSSKPCTEIEEKSAASDTGTLMKCRESARHLVNCTDSSIIRDNNTQRTQDNPPTLLPSSSKEATSTAIDFPQGQIDAQQEVKKEEDQLVHVRPYNKPPPLRKKNQITVKFMTNGLSRGGIHCEGSGSGSLGDNASDDSGQMEATSRVMGPPLKLQLFRPISSLATSLRSMVVSSSRSASHHQARSEHGKEPERRVSSFSWRPEKAEATISEDVCSPFSTSHAQEPVLGVQRQLSPRINPTLGLGRTAERMALSPMVVPRESVMQRPDVANAVRETQGSATMRRPRRPRLTNGTMGAAGFNSMGLETSPSGQYIARPWKSSNNRPLTVATGISTNGRSNLLPNHGSSSTEEDDPAAEAEPVAASSVQGPLAIRSVEARVRPTQLQKVSLSDPPLPFLHAQHRPATVINQPGNNNNLPSRYSLPMEQPDEMTSLSRWRLNSGTFRESTNPRGAKQMPDHAHSAFFLPSSASAREPIKTGSNATLSNLSRALLQRFMSIPKHSTEEGAGSIIIDDDGGPHSSSFRRFLQRSSLSELPNPRASPRSRQLAWNDSLEPTGLQYMESFSQMSAHPPASSAKSDRSSGLVGSVLESRQPSILMMPLPAAAFVGWGPTIRYQEETSDDEDDGKFHGGNREFAASSRRRRGRPVAEATEGLERINAPGLSRFESGCLCGVEIHDPDAPVAFGSSRPTVAATSRSVMKIFSPIFCNQNHSDGQQSRMQLFSMQKHAKAEATMADTSPRPSSLLDCATARNNVSGSGGSSISWWKDTGVASLWWESVRFSWARARGHESRRRALGEGDEQGLQTRDSYDTLIMGAPRGVDTRLLRNYPGKELPMYRLHYEPGCWMVRLGITPPVYVLAWFEFLFEDAVGENKMQLGRETKIILSVWSLNMTHKALCAAILGALGQRTRSALQIWLLLILQGSMLLYLILCRPYVERFVLVVELGCHAAMMVILGCGAGLLNSTPNNQAPSTYVMIVCFFLIAFLIILVGLRVMWLTIKGCWNLRRNKIKHPHTIKRDSQPTIGNVVEDGDDDTGSATAARNSIDSTVASECVGSGAADSNYLAAAINHPSDTAVTPANNESCLLEAIPELPEIQSAILTTSEDHVYRNHEQRSRRNQLAALTLT